MANVRMTVADAAPVRMAVDPARIIEAVSPHVTAERVTGGVLLTVEDARGTQTATVYDGAKGDTGSKGAKGDTGAAGAGVAAGGTQGQVLAKTSGTDYATGWVTPYAGPVTETVTGSTPTVAAAANHRYVCGEVSTLSFTPCETGICDIIFTSGSTAATLTVPNTVKWAGDFDPTSLEANTVYELNVLDGVYGVAVAWS